MGKKIPDVRYSSKGRAEGKEDEGAEGKEDEGRRDERE